jgi:pseudaminic acid synthase
MYTRRFLWREEHELEPDDGTLKREDIVNGSDFALPTSLDSDVLVIAELSANHGGSLQRAVDSIHAAAEAGAGAIKLQTYTPDTMTLECGRDEFVVKGGPWGGRKLYELYEEAHMPWDWHGKLFEVGEALGIPVFSTPFDSSAVEFLEDFNPPAYKIASFEVTDLELLEAVAATKRPVIMSTGMATLGDIDRAVGMLRQTWGGTDPGLILLKCVSAYPARPEDMNLATIPHLAEAFGVVAGLSDHSLGTAIAVSSVALGARVVEKHFTLSRAHGGPDSHFSVEPGELKELVDSVRRVRASIGDVHYGVGAGETGNVLFRRSVFAIEGIAAGQPFTRDNIRVIRPGHGLAPHNIKRLLGRRAVTDIARGTPLSWDVVG